MNGLPTSDDFASKVLDASLNGVYVHDLQLGLNVFVNKRYTDLTGYTLEDLNAINREKFFELFHPEDRQHVAEHMEKISTGREDVLEIEYRFRTKDGRWIWCRSRDSVFARNPDGSTTRFVGTFLDVTDLRKSDLALRESEKRYRELVQHANSAIIRWRSDGTITFFNEYAQSFFGYSAEEAIGRHVNMLVPHRESTGSDLSGLVQDILDHPQHYVNHINENVCRDGRRVWVSWTNRAVLDDNGRVEEIFAVGSDITERKAAEQVMEHQRELLQSIFDNIPILLVLWDPKLQRFQLNPHAETVLGWTSQEANQGNFMRMVYPNDAYRDEVAAYMQSLDTGWQEWTVTTKSGAKVTCDWANIRLSDDTMIGIGVDLRARKKAEQRLRRAKAASEKLNRELEQRVRDRTAEIETQYRELEELNEAIRRLSQKSIEALETDRRALSKEIHDSVAGTLAAIKMQLEAHLEGTAEGAAAEIMPLEKLVAYLTGAIKETKRISSQLRPMTLDDFGLQAALAEHIRQFQEFYPEIEVVSVIELEGKEMATDIQTVLYRVVQEALNNIGKHSRATAAHVKLTCRQDQVRVEVADNGCGFEPRTMLSDADALEGYGIHSMRERIEICKGQFNIISEPARGTRILVSIPMTA
jgi:PAS domain S-box-containing protein